MKHVYLQILFLIGLTNALIAQQQGVLSGYVKDNKTSEPLIGATVEIEELETGTVTDIDGFFRIEDVEPGTYSVTARYLGYSSLTKYGIVVRSAGNIDLNFTLEEKVTTLEEVIVMPSPFVKPPATPLSTQSLSREEVATYPGGNNDIAKVVQSLPGVSGSIGGFRNDVIIRGGAPNENVYYLDGIEIPNINHFSTQGSAGGPVGMLNVSFIDKVDLSSSAFHARYDNALSGILQFRQRKGNDRNFAGNLRVSASEAALTLEGPLFKGEKAHAKTQYLVSVRRSYLQLLFKLIDLPILPDYWDYQYNITHQIDERNTIAIIGIGSIDDFRVQVPDAYSPEQQATLEQVPVIRQWTTTAGISWNRRFKNSNGVMRNSLSVNVLNNEFNKYTDNIEKSGLYFQNDSRETELKFRHEQSYFINNWTITAGLSAQRALYDNNTVKVFESIQYFTDLAFWKYGLFAQASGLVLKDKLDLSIGVRADDNTFTSGGKRLLRTLSPRISASLALDRKQRWKLNASAGRYYKIPPYTILGYTDQTVGTGVKRNKNASYIRSDHIVAGVDYLLTPSSRITLEGFYKRYDDYPVSIKDSISLANKGGGFEVLGNEEIMSVGEGRTYGLELLYQKKLTSQFYGILAYTLFWSEFSGFEGTYLPSVWDARHLLSITGGYQFRNNWELSLRYRLTGKTPYPAVDLETSLANYPDLSFNYSGLGDERLDPFSQLDLRIDKRMNFRRFSLQVYFELQNALGVNTPSPPDYGLNRDEDGNIIEPRSLVRVEDDDSSPLPVIGIVLDIQ